MLLRQQSTVIIFIAGFVLGSIVKPFVESIAKKAGEDAWLALKRLVSRLWRAQARKTYALGADAYIVVEAKGQYVALRISAPARVLPHPKTAALNRAVDRQVKALLNQWPSVGEEIDRAFALDAKAAKRAHSQQVLIIEPLEGGLVTHLEQTRNLWGGRNWL